MTDVSHRSSKGVTVKEWRAAIAASARVWMALHGFPAPLDGPLLLEAIFYLPRPASASKRVTKPYRKPDCSKLIRAVEDALTGIAYVDDSRITFLVVRKRFAIGRAPGVEISLKQDDTE